jgi:hypothetical protein
MGRRRNLSAAVVLSLSLAGVVGCGEEADAPAAVNPAPVVTAGPSPTAVNRSPHSNVPVVSS